MTNIYASSNDRPFPVKLGSLKETLAAEAAENGYSLHRWLRQILSAHVSDKIGIKAEQLRIGNLVRLISGSAIITVTSITDKTINEYPINRVAAIVLNADILKKFGFKMMDGRFTTEGGSFFLVTDGGAYIVKSWHGSQLGKVKFVHQLQNIYSSMMGSELNVRL